MNQFLIKVLKLWEEQKHTGLVIETCRQSGKTTIAIKIAGSEVEKGNKVLFYVNGIMKANELQTLFIKHNGFMCVDMIKFKSINDKTNYGFKPKYTIYDNIHFKTKKETKEKQPNVLKIYTKL